MLANQGQAAEIVSLLSPVVATQTSEATSDWIDVSRYVGDLVILISIGVVTAGSVALSVEDATSDAGAGGAPITTVQGAFTSVTTSNDPLVQRRTVPATKPRGFIRIVGTVTTGPVAISAVLMAHPKYTA